MDVCSMRYENGTFEVVIDKGLLDAIMCGENGWKTGEIMCSEISRVLRKGGIFILISCNVVFLNLQNPEYKWIVKHRPFRTRLSTVCHLYIMQKTE